MNGPATLLDSFCVKYSCSRGSIYFLIQGWVTSIFPHGKALTWGQYTTGLNEIFPLVANNISYHDDVTTWENLLHYWDM